MKSDHHDEILSRTLVMYIYFNSTTQIVYIFKKKKKKILNIK